MSTAVASGKSIALVRCAIYLRITRDDQKTGLGVERQLSKAQALAAALGWSVVIVFDENDTKATGNKPRPKYLEMLAMVRRGELDAVIGYSQDRLTRKPVEAEGILELAGSMGLRCATALGGGEVNFTDPNARHNFRNATAGAALEVELNSARSKDERQQRAEAGRRNGPTPFGWQRVYEVDGSKITYREELHPTEADELRAAARRLLNGVSLRAIATDWNARGLKPRGTGRTVPGPSSGRWSTTQVRRLLLRESNVARRVHRGTVMDGVAAQWPAILDELTYTRVCRLLADPERRSNYRGREVRWLLSGIITCGRPGCPGRIVAKKRSRVDRYIYGCQVCYQCVRTDHLEAYVSQLVADRLANPKLAEPSADAQLELDRLYAAMDAIRAEQAQAGKLVAAKAITLAQLADMNAEWGAQLAELTDRASALLPALAAQTELPNGWDGETDVNVKRAVLQRVFSELVLMPMTTKGQRRVITPEDVRHTFR